MDACARSDLVERKARWLLWGMPYAVIIAGGFAPAGVRAWLWTGAFAVAGAACVLNAARCRRTHCYFTGPLFLILALATGLEGAGVLAIGWAWILAAALAGTAAAYRVERYLGKYASSPAPRR